MRFLISILTMQVLSAKNEGYQPVHNSDSELEASPVSRPLRRLNILTIIPWITTLLLLLSTTYLYTQHHILTAHGSFATGWTTDFGPAKSAIHLETVKFTGSPSWKEEGDQAVAFVPSPGAVNYAGQPSEEVDAAWEKLLRFRYFTMTSDEARETWPAIWQDMYWVNIAGGQSGYLGGLDLFHTLHCLVSPSDTDGEGSAAAEISQNQVRKMLWPEYYPTDDVDYATFQVEHKTHCIDQIRQYIMCAGDLTPIPVMEYDILGGFGYVNSDMPHTCRNFDAIRAWTDQRHVVMKGTNTSVT